MLLYLIRQDSIDPPKVRSNGVILNRSSLAGVLAKVTSGFNEVKGRLNPEATPFSLIWQPFRRWRSKWSLRPMVLWHLVHSKPLDAPCATPWCFSSAIDPKNFEVHVPHVNSLCFWLKWRLQCFWCWKVRGQLLHWTAILKKCKIKTIFLPIYHCMTYKHARPPSGSILFKPFGP